MICKPADTRIQRNARCAKQMWGEEGGVRPLRWSHFQKLLLSCWHRLLLTAFLYFSNTARGISSVTQDLDSVVQILGTL